MVVGVKIMAFDKVTHLLGILKKTTITLKSGTKGESFVFGLDSIQIQIKPNKNLVLIFSVQIQIIIFIIYIEPNRILKCQSKLNRIDRIAPIYILCTENQICMYFKLILSKELK